MSRIFILGVLDMTENNLKNMIENHKLDNLMANREELEKLKSSKTTEQVLEILKKYNYTANKDVFERELLEILQSIKLKGEELKRVSGGKIMNKKNLSMVLGSLMALNSAGFMSAGAVTEEQKNTKEYSVESLLNTVDKKTVKHIGVGSAGIGLLWAIKEIVTSRRDNTAFKLTSIEQKIYSDTKALSDMILEYVRDYIKESHSMPEKYLDIEKPHHTEILQLIKNIRNDWLDGYARTEESQPCHPYKKYLLENTGVIVGNRTEAYSVEITENAVADLFYGLPVGETTVHGRCAPLSIIHCKDREMSFLRLLSKLEDEYRKEFKTLEKTACGKLKR